MVLRDSGTGYVVTIWTIYHVRRGKISIFSVTEKDIDKSVCNHKSKALCPQRLEKRV